MARQPRQRFIHETAEEMILGMPPAGFVLRPPQPKFSLRKAPKLRSHSTRIPAEQTVFAVIASGRVLFANLSQTGALTTIQVEETIESEMVLEGSFIRVRRDVVRTGRGRTATREIVLHPPVVVMLSLDHDGNVLLVRQYRKAIEQETLELPAGGIEEDEAVEDAVRREMVEETGYEPGRIDPLAMIYPSAGMSDELMHIFVVSDLQGDGVPSEPADELEVVRVPFAEACGMVLDGVIKDAKSVAGILMLKSRSLHNEVEESD